MEAQDPATLPSPRIAVVGGGISGLAAAHRLVECRPGLRPVVFEQGTRWGGVLWTMHESGYQIEQSADNFITTIPYGVDLCRRLGLADQLVGTNTAHRQTFVVRRGHLHKLPDGFLMMAPTRLWPLAVTPILSPLGKLRAALEYFLPPRREGGDESMAHFVRRRLGREVFERLVEPLVSGVYAADMEKLSVEATLPQFREMELEHGSLIRAMRRRMAGRPKGQPGDSGARYSMFVTLRDGLSSLIDALLARLPAEGLYLATRVESLERVESRWRLFLSDGRSEVFDGVILASPSHVAACLLEPIDRILAAWLGTIEHSGTAVVSAAFDREQIAHPLDGMGMVMPAVEESPILACSFSSQKYTHRAPEGRMLLRIFAGGARAPELAEMPAEPLCELLLGKLGPLLGIRGDPVFRAVAHWPRTMPQYHIGHKRLVADIERRVADLPGLELAGNAYHGVGIPQCIHSGEEAARRLLERHCVQGS